MIAQLNETYVKRRPWKAVTRVMSVALFEGRAILQRARWLNHVVFAEFAILKRLPQLKAVRQPIYILGPGRTGSTILGQVLSFHKEVGFLNEPKAMWHAFYPHEDVIGSYSTNSAKYALDEADATDDVACAARRLYGAYLRLTGAERIVDKSSEPIFRIPFIHTIFPDAKHLFLARNGWDVVESIGKWSTTNKREESAQTQSWWGVDDRKWYLLVDQIVSNDTTLSDKIEKIRQYTNDYDRAAVEWTVTMRKGLELLESHPDAVKLIRFEDLCREPRKVLSEIAEFCELKKDDAFLNYGEETLKPVQRREPRQLPPEITPVFHDTMTKLGYE